MKNLIKFAIALMIIGAAAIVAPPLYCAFKAAPLPTFMGAGMVIGVTGMLILLIHYDDD